jgi:hypothetical protein
MSKVQKVAGSREVGKGKVVPVLNEAHHHQNIRRNGGIAPPLSTLALDRSERSASRAGPFSPWYLLDRRLGGPWSRSLPGRKPQLSSP